MSGFALISADQFKNSIPSDSPANDIPMKDQTEIPVRPLSIIGVIPARYASTRFPGKPLADILGKSMIQRVVEQVQKCTQLSQVIVATDDLRIADHVEAFGGEVALTSPDHESGTERMGEVAQTLKADYFINIQGDEPLIDPGQIDQVAGVLRAGANIATLIFPQTDQEKILNPNSVKVVVDEGLKALYFSRSPIPYLREPSSDLFSYWQHIGIYGFSRGTLLDVVALPMHPLEQAEKLEQLRWLGNGYPIQCGISSQPGHSVDSPEDLEAIIRLLL